MTQTLLMLLATAPLLAHGWFVQRHRGLFNADAIFVWFQWTMALGAVLVVEPDQDVGRRFLTLSILPLVIYCVVSYLLFRRSDSIRPGEDVRAPDVDVQPMAKRDTRWAWSILLVSAAITAVYFVAVGYNVFLLGVRGVFTGESLDYTTLRLESYAPNRYLFPGYVNQFRNILLPSAALVLVWSAYRKHVRVRHLLAAVLGAVSVVSLMGTGQRGAFILFVVVAIVFLRWASALRIGRPLLIGSLLGLPALFFATLLLGRSQAQLDEGSSPFSSVVVIGKELLERFFIVNQQSGYDAVIFIRDRPTQWGMEWLQGIVGLTPWSSGSPLAREVFESLYGTDRGTAPITLWGSVYYNFWWWGVVAAPALLAFVAAWLVKRTRRSAELSAVEAVGMAGVAVVFGTWVAGAPDQLVNNGIVAFALLWWLGCQLREDRNPFDVRRLRWRRASRPSRSTSMQGVSKR